MRQKPKVVKNGDHWTIRVPGYGFASDSDVGEFPTQQAALSAAVNSRRTATGGSFERATTPAADFVRGRGARIWQPVIR